MGTAPTATTGLLAFDTEDNGALWCLPIHDRAAALAAWRGLSEPVSPWAPTETDLPHFAAVWVTTTEDHDGEMTFLPAPASTPGALPALTWGP